MKKIQTFVAGVILLGAITINSCLSLMIAVKGGV